MPDSIFQPSNAQQLRHDNMVGRISFRIQPVTLRPSFHGFASP